MKIDIISLLDLVELVLKLRKTTSLFEDPAKTMLEKHVDDDLVRTIQEMILLENYEQAIILIENYKHLNRELYSVYHSILREYQKNVNILSGGKLVDLINDKFGIRNVKEVVALIRQKEHLRQMAEQYD
jgi:hypothetical protein